jgi:hypothetical protein
MCCVRCLSVFSPFKDFGLFASFYDKPTIISSDFKNVSGMKKHNICKARFKIMAINNKRNENHTSCHYYGAIIFLIFI